MDLLESPAYCQRLLMYKGRLTPESLLSSEGENEHATEAALATQGYGVGNWPLHNGDEARTKEMFAQVLRGKTATLLATSPPKWTCSI